MFPYHFSDFKVPPQNAYPQMLPFADYFEASKSTLLDKALENWRMGIVSQCPIPAKMFW
jgi:hypothetical protein